MKSKYSFAETAEREPPPKGAGVTMLLYGTKVRTIKYFFKLYGKIFLWLKLSLINKFVGFLLLSLCACLLFYCCLGPEGSLQFHSKAS